MVQSFFLEGFTDLVDSDWRLRSVEMGSAETAELNLVEPWTKLQKKDQLRPFK